MSQLRHPHIVQFLGVAYLPGSPIPVLLMEKLQTSLDNLLETSPNIPLDVKVHLLTGTAQGVVYLHSRDPPIAHRDLTARNILIDSGLTAKIADLGVARMVNIQPGQLAATNACMPPETVQEDIQSNTAIDIFSFGVVSLFTLTQTFPKDLKPATYRDPVTKRLLGRTEVERRGKYIKVMQTALGRTHLLVKLTLGCLEYQPEDRPSAVEVLRRLEEVGKTIPQRTNETKLKLIQQIDELKEKSIEQIQSEHQKLIEKQLSEKSMEVQRLQRQIDHLQTEKDNLQTANSRLQEQVRRGNELQQQQLDAQRREMERLSGQLQSLELQHQEEATYRPPQESKQIYPATVGSPASEVR